MYEEYNAIRRQAEMDGYILDDDTFEYFVQYAKRKAEIAGKDESYIPYLLTDVIKEFFFSHDLNKLAVAKVEFERYIQNITKMEVQGNGRADYRKAVAR